MRRWREVFVVLTLFGAASPVAAQVDPEGHARRLGAEDCALLARAPPDDGYWTIRAQHNGPGRFVARATFDVTACFRSPQACERFAAELTDEFAGGSFSCRPAALRQ